MGKFGSFLIIKFWVDCNFGFLDEASNGFWLKFVKFQVLSSLADDAKCLEVGIRMFAFANCLFCEDCFFLMHYLFLSEDLSFCRY